MMLTAVNKQKLKNFVQRVLHVQGNYQGGILEMAFVLDHALDCGEIRTAAADTAAVLKQTDEVFRNVRLNLIDWYSDENIQCSTGSLPHVQMGRPFENWETIKADKKLEILCEYLKKFQARSKLIVVFTGDISVGSRECLENALKPFLYGKLIIFNGNEILYRSISS